MRQIVQKLSNGETILLECPTPVCGPGDVLIRTRATLVSQGTEKMLVQFGKANLFQKARSQPEKVRQVLQKIRTDGLVPTLDAVFRRLDEPLPLGYCNAGVVVAVGEGVRDFAVGDRVASNGPHAEYVNVPANLCARIPTNVPDEQAAFTVAGAISLQGIRLLAPQLGETVVVIGLGLLGQLAVQLLKAHGCRVIGFDFDSAKVEIARQAGIEAECVGPLDPVKHALSLSGGQGVDAVLITASSDSNEVIAQAARMSRKRGRIVLVGVIGLQLSRADFYEKELTFQVSCSYGPGRYENNYEEKGLDYPAAFVRWTEQRNFEAVLAAMSSGCLAVGSLITRRVPLARFGDIYNDLAAGGLASILDYPVDGAAATRGHIVTVSQQSFTPADGAIAIVGTGNFTKMTLVPSLRASAAKVKYLVSASGVSSTHLAEKAGIPHSTTDYTAVLNDPDVRAVIISTRHNLHARQTVAALQAGKHVLVEKPLCLTKTELDEISAVVTNLPPGGPTLAVGFNRRFSPHARKIQELLGTRPGPLSIVATMNAGAIPPKHWVHDPDVGGGRLVGEACHFVDFAVFVTGSLVTHVCANALGGGAAASRDSASIMLRHANGSNSVVNYLANGHREYPKERIEVFAQERVLVLDDFRKTSGYGVRGFSTLKTRPDKGHASQFAEFARRVREGGGALIPWPQIENVARATLAIGASLRANAWVSVE